MPKFLVQTELYRLIQRELLDGVYPDGSPDKFKSTASVSSKAKVLATAYSNLARIYDNFFPQTADELQNSWEDKILGFQLDSSLSLVDRRAVVVEKIRTQRRTTAADMKAIIYQYIPSSTLVDILQRNCAGGDGSTGWILDESQLEIETYLGSGNGLRFPAGENLCGKTAADWGMTAEDFAEYQNQAYIYDVQIYGYILTTDQRSAINQALSDGEPMRSGHTITDNLDYQTQSPGGMS